MAASVARWAAARGRRRAAEEAAALFKVLGSEARLEILGALAGGPLATGAVARAAGVPPYMAQVNLRLLRLAGLVEAVGLGRRAVNRLTDAGLRALRGARRLAAAA